MASIRSKLEDMKLTCATPRTKKLFIISVFILACVALVYYDCARCERGDFENRAAICRIEIEEELYTSHFSESEDSELD